jgi:hypothetical protein
MVCGSAVKFSSQRNTAQWDAPEAQRAVQRLHQQTQGGSGGQQNQRRVCSTRAGTPRPPRLPARYARPPGAAPGCGLPPAAAPAEKRVSDKMIRQIKQSQANMASSTGCPATRGRPRLRIATSCRNSCRSKGTQRTVSYSHRPPGASGTGCPATRGPQYTQLAAAPARIISRQRNFLGPATVTRKRQVFNAACRATSGPAGIRRQLPLCEWLRGTASCPHSTRLSMCMQEAAVQYR